MRLPERDKVIALIAPPGKFYPPVHIMDGVLSKVSPVLLCATLPGVRLGEVCTLPDGSLAQIITVENDKAYLSPYNDPAGVSCHMRVMATGQSLRLGVGEGMLGRVLDSLGMPLDALGDFAPEDYYEMNSSAPSPLTRCTINQPIETGIRAIDALLTVGEGQRMGIFSPAGCGKSTLLGMLAGRTDVDVVVLALIGERGREVREFLEYVLPENIRERCVIIVATSDKPPLERINAASAATTVAEYFRAKGKRVLLLVDSLTRYARAVREIALVSGEPVLSGGYPPSLYTMLPRLLERVGKTHTGSISAFYTVLTEDRHDALSEEIRSLLDGHIILSRKLAESGHYPAIDILASVSRVMSQITSKEHRDAAYRMRKMMSLWQELELLVRVGEYVPGHDPDADKAVSARPGIDDFLCQKNDQVTHLRDSISELIMMR